MVQQSKSLIKNHGVVIATLYRLVDCGAIVLSSVIANILRFQGYKYISPLYDILVLGAVLLTLIVFNVLSVYQNQHIGSIKLFSRKLLLSSLVVVFFLMTLAFFTKTSINFSRIWIAEWLIVSFLLMFLGRIVLSCLLNISSMKSFSQRSVIVVGDGKLVDLVCKNISSALNVGYNVSSIVSPEDFINSDGGVELPFYQTIKQGCIDEIWLVLPLKAEDTIKRLLHALRFSTVNVSLVPDIFGLDLLNHSMSEVAGMPLLNLSSTPMQGSGRLVKTLEDRLIASVILIALSPIMLIIAGLVMISSPGPIFYRQTRITWNDNEFNMLKFRSMPVKSEHTSGPVWSTLNDKRATTIGNFLRKTSLDELPQFFNVLKGDMSIVGPRPERPVFVNQFKHEVPKYMKKHMMKAGITGWAQVNGWRGNTDLSKRIEYDIYYIENWSLWFDLKIIMMTISKVFYDRNAH